MKRFFILAACAVVLFACGDDKKDEPKATNDTTMNADAGKDKTPPQSEIGDPKYTDWGKKMTAQMAAGDIDGWLSNYADNAKYYWSSGDSLSGKAEIAKYWKDRRTNVIDSISFTNQIWLPLKVNKPQAGPDQKGMWSMSWYFVNVKYKNGKKLGFWTHTDNHYDANDKIDVTVQYIDRAPIMAALGHK